MRTEGKISAVSIKEKTFGIQLNPNEWYSGFLNNKPAWLEPDCREYVEFEFETKGIFKNIVKDTLNIKKSDTSEPEIKPQGVLEFQPKPIFGKNEEVQRDIRRQVALKAAVEVFCHTVALKTIDEADSRKEYIRDMILYYAEEFGAWLNREENQNFP